MASARTTRGRQTQRFIAEWLREHGWPHADSPYGSEPGRDIKNIDGFAIEVKSRSNFDPRAWLRQASRHQRGAGEIPTVILRCNGQGEAQVGEYLVIRLLRDDELNKLRELA